MPEYLTVDAEVAQTAVNNLLKRQRRMRKREAVDPAIRSLSDATRIYIFNIGPWSHKRECGDWGEFIIPACEEGKPYAVMAPIDGIFIRDKIEDEANFRNQQWSGRFVAEQIVGVGRHMSSQGDYSKWGVFIGSRHEPIPTAEELTVAKRALVARCKILIKEASAAFNKGAKEAENLISERHRWAANYLGRPDLPWVEQFEPGVREACYACGTFVGTDMAVCPSCHEVVKPELLEQRRAERRGKLAKRAN